MLLPMILAWIERTTVTPGMVHVVGEEIGTVVPQLRDQFAMAALTGWLASRHPKDTDEWHAGKAYRLADAMLAARAARGKGKD